MDHGILSVRQATAPRHRAGICARCTVCTILSSLVLFVVGVCLGIGVLVPTVSGANTYRVLSGSMEPAIPTGSLVIVRPCDEAKPGDVITFDHKADTVTHRVVDTVVLPDGTTAYQTKGDANARADEIVVQHDQVHGTVWYQVPYLGIIAGKTTGPVTLLVVSSAVGLSSRAAWWLVSGRCGRAL